MEPEPEKEKTEPQAGKEEISEKEKPDGIGNIFDTVFRTMVEYLPHLIIPVINEVFGTDYPEDEPMAVLKNEHVTHGGKIITDLFFEMRDKHYHVEVQSTADGRMMIRIMEYAAAIAIESAVEQEDGSYRMKFPNSCVIYLRSTKNTPEKLTMQMDFPNGEQVVFAVPLLKVQEYTKDQLFQKRLLLLLPYYLMRYEKELKKIGRLEPERQAEANQRMDVFLREYQDLCDRLFAACEEEENYYLYTALAEQIQSIAEYLAPNNEKERVVAMGGTVIKPQAQIILERGIEQGIERGIEQGIEQGEMKAKKETTFSLFDMGMPPEKIAQAVKVSLDTIQQWLGNDTVPIK